MKIAIIGGGMGGLALANALLQRGIEATIFEQADGLMPIGAGIQLTPNAVKVLRGIDVADGLDQCGFLPEATTGRDWRSGKIVFQTPLSGVCETLYHAPYVHIHRGDLQALLLKNLPADMIRFSSRCVRVENRSDSAVAHFADGSSVAADLIVAADGIKSAVRGQFFGKDAPRFTGNICWRSVVRFDNGPGFDLVRPDNSIWFGPNGHIVTYYVHGGRGVNIVACLESSAWQEESWNIRSSSQELAEAYAGWHPKLQQLFAQAEDVYKWGLFDRDPMSRWTEGRVTLLGDAAHPMLPYLSQGAAMAMEDALVLARMLERHSDSIDAALADYEAIRIPRTARVQSASREQGKKNHLVSPLARLRRDIAYRIVSLFDKQATGLKAGWVYEYDANTVIPAAASTDVRQAVAAH